MSVLRADGGDRVRRASLVVLVGGLAVSALAAWSTARHNELELEARFQSRAERLASRLVQRLATYEYGLRGARGAIQAAGEHGITPQIFRIYMQSRELAREFPGARGFGFVRRRAADGPNGSDRAPGHDGTAPAVTTTAERWSIELIEPLALNQEALALDLAAEPKRREAAAAALRSGQATLTAPITLVQAAQAGPQGFLLLLPIYRPGEPVETEAQRTAAGYGWAYTPIVTHEVLAGFDELGDGLVMALSDASGPGRPERFFDAPVGGTGLAQTLTRDLYGRRWQVHVEALPKFVDGLNLVSPRRVFASGALATLLASALLAAMLGNRQREWRLRAQQVQLSTIVENSSDAIVGETPDGVVTSWNPAAERLFGHTAADALGRRTTELIVPPGLRADEAARRARVLDGNALPAADVAYRAADGRSIDVSETLSPLRAPDGHIVGIARSLRDVADRKAAEAAQRDFSARLERMVQERSAQFARASRDLETLLDATPALIAYWDQDLRLGFANQAFHAEFGAPHGSLRGCRPEDFQPPELLAATRPHMLAALRGEAQTFEREDLRFDGRRQHIVVRYRPDVGESGVRGFYVLVHDVTELVESRLALARERERLDNILRGTDAGTWEWNVATGEARFNARWAEIVGETLEALAPMDIDTWTSRIHPEDLAVSRELLARHFADASESYECELRLRRRDGGWVWVLGRGRLHTRTPDGAPEWIYGTHLDITRRREAQRRLAESEAFLERAGRVAGIGGWQLEVASGRLEWTAQTRRIHEVDDDHTPTLDESVDFFAAGARQTMRQALRAATERGEGWDLELPIHTARGRAVWVRTIGEAEYGDGSDERPVRIVGAVQDITARRIADQALLRVEAAEAANAAKTRFLANMSHEIRTPMNAVVGVARLLEHTALDGDQRRLVDRIQVASRTLLGLINDVLDLAKIESGAMRIERLDFDLATMLRELGELFEAQAAAKGIELVWPELAALPRHLHGDATRVRQILANLVGNAIKFTARGQVALHVEVVDPQGDPLWLRLAVRDTGIGIAAPVLAGLWEPFTQADASTTRRFGGSGLGLSIVRQLAELMGGTTGATSQPGAGSTFWVELPFGPVSDRPAEPQRVELRIAVADEERRSALQAQAHVLGWRVTVVSPDTTQPFDTTVASDAARQREAAQPGVVWVLDRQAWEAASAGTGARWRAEAPPGVPVVVLDDDEGVASTGDAVVPLTATRGVTGLLDAVHSAVATSTGDGDLVLALSDTTAADAAWLDSLHILVVDDSEVNLEVAQRLLEAAGAHVTAFDDAEAALHHLQSHPHDVDAVLMDVQMPRLDGREATRRLRQVPALATLPVVALTAGALVTERQLALDAGMDDFISKPLDPAHLVRVLRRLVQARRATVLPIVPHQRTRPAAARQPGLEELTQIDLPEARARLGHDDTLLWRLLARLQREFGDLATCPAPADAPARERLRARLHKLRGSAGTIGLRPLMQAAGDAEAALVSAAGEPGAALATLGATLDRLLRELAPLLDAHPVDGLPPADAGASAAALSPGDLTALQELLRSQDLRAVQRIDALAASLAARLGAERWKHLRRAIDELDFARAAQLLHDELTPA